MTAAAVIMWGRRIGAVSVEEPGSYAAFRYDPEFVRAGPVELSPLTMPLSDEVYVFSGLSRDTFRGLPGMLADALPDRFGNSLIDMWLASQGRAPESFDVVERLCYVGSRAIGALEFEPAIGPETEAGEPLQLEALVELASRVMKDREAFREVLQDGTERAVLQQILRVGTSAGGARPKAVIAWNPETGEMRSGQLDHEQGFQHWIIKLDGVDGQARTELGDSGGYGVIEYAYHLMARAAGIHMNECRLLEEGERRHFMTRRFDRTDEGRLHMQSLGAIAHFDFNLAGAHSYEQAIMTIRRLGLSMREIEEQYRRAVFNVMARNQDDHVKNIAFLMDRVGEWRLSPAFDLTFAYNSRGAWTATHQMSLNAKRDGFELDDLLALADYAALKRSRATGIIEEVREAVHRWEEFAGEAGVDGATASAIGSFHRLIPG